MYLSLKTIEVQYSIKIHLTHKKNSWYFYTYCLQAIMINIKACNDTMIL